MSALTEEGFYAWSQDALDDVRERLHVALTRTLDEAPTRFWLDRWVTVRPAPEPVTLAGLLARRPELRGVGISEVLEARWTA